MRTRSVIFWAYFLSLSWLGGVRKVHGEGEGSSSDTLDSSQQRRRLSAFEEGLQPFYKMTNIFLGFVQNRDLSSANPIAYGKLTNLVSSLTDDENANTGQPPPDTDITPYFVDNWRSLVSYGIGYVVCVCVGLLFVLVMPIVGCCFCCCRLCGCCGGKVKPREGRHHKCRQLTCGTLLFVFTTIMLVGMVFAFMTNEQIRLRATPGPDGVIGKTRGLLTSLNSYTTDLSRSIKRTFTEDVTIELTGILNMLDKLPDTAIISIDEVTNATTILEMAEKLGRSVKKMLTLLHVVQNTRTTIYNMKTPLTNKLNSIKQAVINIITGCQTAECASLSNSMMTLDISVDFSQLNVNSQISSLDPLNNIGMILGKRTASYNEIKALVNSSVASVVTEVTAQKDSILTEIQKVVDDFADNIKNITTPVDQAKEYLTPDIEKSIEEYREYYWYAGIGLTCVFLLIVLCFYLGLLFGVCGEPPYEDSNACNKGVGANLLLGAVGFCFLFGWLLMLVCLLLFVPGALLHGEVCRYVSPDIDSSPYSRLIDDLTYRYIQEYNLGHNMSAIINNCKNNMGLYSALGLENIVNLSILNIDKYGIKSKANQLIPLTVDLSSIKVIDGDSRAQLVGVRDSMLDNITFMAFFSELDKNSLTVSNVTMIINQMTAAMSALDPTNGASLQTQIDELRMLRDSDIKTFEEKLGELRKALDDLKNEISGEKGTMQTLSQKIDGLITSLDNAQKNIDNGSGLTRIRKLFSDTADRVYQEVVNFTTATKSKIKNDVGKCRPLYNVISGSINIVCVDFLYPFNGFWFSFGWCLAFFIPAIIAAVHLAGSYRKTEEYDPTDTKSFDDPNFDAYSGGMFPGDNIPLEDYDRRKNRSRAGGRGHPNSGYERDAHPSSHAPPAAMPYRDNYSRDNYARNGGPPAYPDHEPHQRHRGGGGGYGGATPPNPPHYYNNRPVPH